MDNEGHQTLASQGIVEILNKLKIKVTAKDLKNPTIETAITIYRGFLEECLVVTKATFDMDAPDTMIHFLEDTIKFQSDSFKFLQLYIFIVYFYDLMGMKPLFKDIFFPSKKLFNKQCCQLIEFTRFMNMQMTDFAEVQEKNRKYIEQCDEYMNKNADLRSKVNCLTLERNEKRNHCETTRRKVMGFKEKLAAIKEETKKLAEKDQAALKEEEAYLVEKEELDRRFKAIDKKNVIYEKLLIKSPDRLKRDMEKCDIRVKELEKCIKTRNDEIAEEKKVLFERENFIQNFKSIRETLESFFQNDVQKANNINKEIEKEKEDLIKSNFLYKELLSVEKTLKGESDKLNENLEFMKLNFEKQFRSSKEKKEENLEKAKHLAKKIDEIKDKLNSYTESHNKFKANVEKTMNDAIDQITESIKNQTLEQIKSKASHEMLDNMHKDFKRITEKKINSFSMFLDKQILQTDFNNSY